MRPVQYIIANQGADMSPGKLAAQVAHAAVIGYTETPDGHLDREWWATGHTKIVLAARDNDHMLWAERYLADQGFMGHLIIDEGRTEVPPLTPTALGFPILDKDDEKVQFAFSTFELYKESKPTYSITKPPADFGHRETGMETEGRGWWPPFGRRRHG